MPDTANNATPPETMPGSAPVPATYSAGMPPAMAMWLDDRVFDRARLIAKYLSEADGFVPKHLLRKPMACMAVVSRSLTWRLDPYAVANCTYETPGGRVGFEGKLVQGILENSGKLEGGVRFIHFGDWGKVLGKFELRKGTTGKDYAAATWGRADAEGLGVRVSCKVKGEVEPRETELLLIQCFPLNSTLWATDPKTQICYTAVRRFASVAVPGLLMGIPFDDESVPGETARDITPPRPTRADVDEAFSRSQKRERQPEDESQDEETAAEIDYVGPDGEVRALALVDWLAAARKDLAEPLTPKEIAGWEESNGTAIDDLGPDETELAAQAQIREMLAQAKESAARRDRRPEPQQQDGAGESAAAGQAATGQPGRTTAAEPTAASEATVRDAPSDDPPATASPAPCTHPRTALYGDGSEVCRDCQVVVKPAPAPAPAQQQAQPAGDLLSRPAHDYPELYRSLREGLDTLNTIGDIDHFLRLSEEQVDALRGDKQLSTRFETAVGDRRQALTRGKRR